MVRDDVSLVPCPCCRKPNFIPDEVEGELAICPECGQCLYVPAPWSNNQIRPCDTRPMVGAPMEQALGVVPDDGQIPADLTCRIPDATTDKSRSHLWFGLLGILLGLFVLGGGIWGAPRADGTELWRWLAFSCGTLVLISGMVLIRAGLKKKRPVSKSRIVPLPDSFPADGFLLGTPFAQHQTSSFSQKLNLITSALVCAAGLISLALVLGGHVEGRLLEIGLLGTAGGGFTFFHTLRHRRLSVLVFPGGLVVFQKQRAEVWRWDEIETIWLKPDFSVAPLTGYACMMVRHDGERCTLSLKIDFVENQLGVRVQQEVSSRLLPRILATLRTGGTVDFGPFEISQEGLHKNEQLLRWDEIAAWHLAGPDFTILTDTGRRYGWRIANLPNLVVLLKIVQSLRTHSSTKSPRLSV